MQKTIQKQVVTSGSGLFTGEKVSLKICPAAPNTGIRFQRVDLPGKPQIAAHHSFVKETPRCTRLANETSTIFMVEHLLSALRGMGVDNVLVEVDGPEIVAADGSSKLFVELIEEAGIVSQEAPLKVIQIKEPLYFSDKDVQLIALPSPLFQISYTLHYPQSALLGSQFYHLTLTPERFKKEIAPCRTFSLYEEILPLIEKGFIKGGGLENALVIQGDRILNPEGARFPDEMVRHKVLDLIGDLSLVGAPILGHIISIRSGHASNLALAKMIAKLERN